MEYSKNNYSRFLEKNNVRADHIRSIGITNQRETTCAFDIAGNPLHNAIVWQDRRTANFCTDLKEKGLESKVKSLTGLPLDPYFSATKMNWLLNNSEVVKKSADNNDLKFGTIDTFLLYKLTGSKIHATEGSNASRTLLMNLENCTWDPELLEIFDIKAEYLPKIESSFGQFGFTAGLDFLPDGIPISGILGDQQAALFGQAGLKKGDSKCTYGTGAFMLLNTGNEKIYSENGLLTTVAYNDGNNIQYALEGSCYIAGAAVQWVRDNLKLIKESHEIEMLANQVQDLDEVEHILLLPFFTGIGSPHWNSEAKAALVGMTRDTADKHIARATLEGIALSINDLLNAMEQDLGEKISSLNVDGGAVANSLLMQIQSNFSKINIVKPEIIETTAYGAALAAAIGSNLIKKEKIKELWKEEKVFKPSNSDTKYFENKNNLWANYIKKLY